LCDKESTHHLCERRVLQKGRGIRGPRERLQGCWPLRPRDPRALVDGRNPQDDADAAQRLEARVPAMRQKGPCVSAQTRILRSLTPRRWWIARPTENRRCRPRHSARDRERVSVVANGRAVESVAPGKAYGRGTKMTDPRDPSRALAATSCRVGDQSHRLARVRSVPVTSSTLDLYRSTRSEGIYLIRMDRRSGQLRRVGSWTPARTRLPHHPPQRRVLYAVNELGKYNGRATGAVTAFAIQGYRRAHPTERAAV